MDDNAFSPRDKWKLLCDTWESLERRHAPGKAKRQIDGLKTSIRWLQNVNSRPSKWQFAISREEAEEIAGIYGLTADIRQAMQHVCPFYALCDYDLVPERYFI